MDEIIEEYKIKMKPLLNHGIISEDEMKIFTEDIVHSSKLEIMLISRLALEYTNDIGRIFEPEKMQRVNRIFQHLVITWIRLMTCEKERKLQMYNEAKALGIPSDELGFFR